MIFDHREAIWLKQLAKPNSAPYVSSKKLSFQPLFPTVKSMLRQNIQTKYVFLFKEG
jgi:hypothetical protein